MAHFTLTHKKVIYVSKHVTYSIPLPKEITPMLRYTILLKNNFITFLIFEAPLLKITKMYLNSEKIWRGHLGLKKVEDL